MYCRTWIVVGLAVLILTAGADGQERKRKKKIVAEPPVTTITGTITLKSSTGKPSGKGEIEATLSRFVAKTPEEWVVLGTQVIAVTANETGPWKYTIKVLVPQPPEKKTAPSPSLPVAVFARYKGPWSVSTGGGPIRAASPKFGLKIGQTNVVDLVLKAEFIN